MADRVDRAGRVAPTAPGASEAAAGLAGQTGAGGSTGPRGANGIVQTLVPTGGPTVVQTGGPARSVPPARSVLTERLPGTSPATANGAIAHQTPPPGAKRTPHRAPIATAPIAIAPIATAPIAAQRSARELAMNVGLRIGAMNVVAKNVILMSVAPRIGAPRIGAPRTGGLMTGGLTNVIGMTVALTNVETGRGAMVFRVDQDRSGGVDREALADRLGRDAGESNWIPSWGSTTPASRCGASCWRSPHTASVTCGTFGQLPRHGSTGSDSVRWSTDTPAELNRSSLPTPASSRHSRPFAGRSPASPPMRHRARRPPDRGDE